MVVVGAHEFSFVLLEKCSRMLQPASLKALRALRRDGHHTVDADEHYERTVPPTLATVNCDDLFDAAEARADASTVSTVSCSARSHFPGEHPASSSDSSCASASEVECSRPLRTGEDTDSTSANMVYLLMPHDPGAESGAVTWTVSDAATNFDIPPAEKGGVAENEAPVEVVVSAFGQGRAMRPAAAALPGELSSNAENANDDGMSKLGAGDQTPEEGKSKAGAEVSAEAIEGADRLLAKLDRAIEEAQRGDRGAEMGCREEEDPVDTLDEDLLRRCEETLSDITPHQLEDRGPPAGRPSAAELATVSASSGSGAPTLQASEASASGEELQINAQLREADFFELPTFEVPKRHYEIISEEHGTRTHIARLEGLAEDVEKFLRGASGS